MKARNRGPNRDSGMELHTTRFASPLGWILMAAGPPGICLLHFCGPDRPSEEDACRIILERLARGVRAIHNEDHDLLGTAKEAILNYLEQGTALPTLLIDLGHGTPFQQEVWSALSRIPYGETRTYRQVAQDVGRPSSARAVGGACGRNLVPIFVPCHRVLASGGKLGGYSGGTGIKEALLKREGIMRRLDKPRT